MPDYVIHLSDPHEQALQFAAKRDQTTPDALLQLHMVGFVLEPMLRLAMCDPTWPVSAQAPPGLPLLEPPAIVPPMPTVTTPMPTEMPEMKEWKV